MTAPEPQQTNKPIFFALTRSFWLTVFGVLTLLAGDMEAVQAFAEIAALLLPGVETPEPIVEWSRKLAPAVLFIAALQQRSGAARPYSRSVRDR